MLLCLIVLGMFLFLVYLQKQPDASAYLVLGLKFSAKGDYDKAIEKYTYAIKIKPDYAKAYALRAEAYRANGDDKESNKDLGIAKALRGGQ